MLAVDSPRTSLEARRNDLATWIAVEWHGRLPAATVGAVKTPIDQRPFDALLRRLGPDRETAGLRYLELKRRLVAVFEHRGCPDPEVLADDTLDRTARKLEELGSEFVGGDPSRYAFGVAWNVARESFRRPLDVPLPDGWERGLAAAAPPDERDARCLERCLERLEASERTLVLSYHQGERSARIRRRSELARDLTLSPNALRLKVHRITGRLRECVLACVDQAAAGPES